MKQRSPVSLEGCITRVKDILGAAEVARLLDISESMVYKRCDAEHASSLRFSDALKLDAECRAKCGESPLLDFYQEQIENSPVADVKASLEVAAIELARDVGEVEGEILSLRDVKGQSLSNRNVIDIQEGLQKVKRCVASMETIVTKSGQSA